MIRKKVAILPEADANDAVQKVQIDARYTIYDGCLAPYTLCFPISFPQDAMGAAALRLWRYQMHQQVIIPSRADKEAAIS